MKLLQSFKFLQNLAADLGAVLALFHIEISTSHYLSDLLTHFISLRIKTFIGFLSALGLVSSSCCQKSACRIPECLCQGWGSISSGDPSKSDLGGSRGFDISSLRLSLLKITNSEQISYWQDNFFKDWHWEIVNLAITEMCFFMKWDEHVWFVGILSRKNISYL